MNDIFGDFLKSATCKETLTSFTSLCEAAGVEYPPHQNESRDHCTFYRRLKKSLSSSWKAQSLFSKLDKKYLEKLNFRNSRNNQENGARIAQDLKVLIIGAGPCGLRTAIHMALIGAKAIVIEKRDSFSRNNVLHLWPFTIEDLRSLGAKKFNGRFCSGAIDHVSIRQLQLILLKSALLFGVEVHVNTSFCDLIEPSYDNGVKTGWRAKIEPSTSPVATFEFNAIIAADGQKNSLKGFAKKVFRASLAIGITVNFINRNTTAEAKVPEISGINFIYRQDFFRDLNKKCGIDLENIVYYKDDTHYFVMTAKKQSLLARGVFKKSLDDPSELVKYENIDQAALLKYALDAVNFSTNNKLPDLEVALNNYGRPDIALFDFTCMKSSVIASFFREVEGQKLLLGLVGDGLLEPFWPRGTGIAKGFLASFDIAWMVRQWASKQTINDSTDNSLELSLLAEREAIYRILAQTENRNVQDYSSFSLDPKSRYQHVPSSLKLHQVKEFYVCDKNDVDTIQNKPTRILHEKANNIVPSSLTRNVSFLKSKNLLNWCQSILNKNTGIKVIDMSSSWKNGLALCYLIGVFRPDLIAPHTLSPDNSKYNNQLAFDIAEEHLGITPILSGEEMAECEEVDDLLMITYISQFYEIFKKEKPVAQPSLEELPATTEETPTKVSSSKAKKLSKAINSSSPVGLFTRISQHIKRKSLQRNSSNEYDVEEQNVKRKKVSKKQENEVATLDSKQVILTKAVIPTIDEDDKENEVVMREKAGGEARMHKSATNRISALGLQLISQFEQNSSTSYKANQTSSNVCHFCGKRVYIVEKLSVEGLFFHRECFKCSHCEVTLRPMNYKRDPDSGKFYCEVHFYANAEYLKPMFTTGETEMPVEAKEATEVTSEVNSNLENKWDEDAVFEEETPMVATIENGQVVMKHDLTPKRGIMESMKLSLSEMTEEVPEEILTQHNLSNHFNTEDVSSSSDSDEDWNAIANETLGLGNQSPQQILTDYHTKAAESKRKQEELYLSSTTGTSDATLLSSASEGDEDVSSLSSGSIYEQPTSKSEKESLENPMKSELKEADSSSDTVASEDTDDDINNMKEASPMELEQTSAIQKDNEQQPLQSLPKETTISSEESVEHEIKESELISAVEKENEPSKLSSETTDTLVTTEESAVQSKSDLHQTDTLDRYARYIADNPVEKVLSSCQSSYPEEVQEGSINKESLSVLSDTSVPDASMGLSSSQLERQQSEKAVASFVGSQLLTHSAIKNNTSIWTSDIENNPDKKVSVVHESNIKTFAVFEPDTDSIAPETIRDPEMIKTGEFSNITSVSHLNPDQFSTPERKLPASSPVSSENDTFFTPAAQTVNRSDDDSFFSVDSDVSLHNSYLSEMTPRYDEVDGPLRRSDESKPVATETSPKRSPRKLPEIPKRKGRRLLPVVPKIDHLEALSPTGSKVKEPGYINHQLRKHEESVQARIRKMKLQQTAGSSDPQTQKDSGCDLPLLSKPAEMPRKKHKQWEPVVCDTKKKTTHKKTQSKLFSFPHRKKGTKVKAVASPTDTLSPEEIENKIVRRVRIAAQKQAKQAEQKRLARALVIQRQLEEVDMKRKLLEEKGVELEKSLRSDQNKNLSKHRESSVLMHEWFKLVQEKNALLRYENELMIYRRELQLEDRQSRLQQELRERMARDDSKKTTAELSKEKIILNEMLEVIEQRNQLVILLDEHRIQDKEESADIEGILLEKFSKISSGTDSYLASS